MSLPLLVLSLTLIFFLLKLSGLLDDLSSRRPGAGPPAEDQPRPAGIDVARDAKDRLRVFRDFIDRLPPPGDEPPADAE